MVVVGHGCVRALAALAPVLGRVCQPEQPVGRDAQPLGPVGGGGQVRCVDVLQTPGRRGHARRPQQPVAHGPLPHRHGFGAVGDVVAGFVVAFVEGMLVGGPFGAQQQHLREAVDRVDQALPRPARGDGLRQRCQPPGGRTLAAQAHLGARQQGLGRAGARLLVVGQKGMGQPGGQPAAVVCGGHRQEMAGETGWPRCLNQQVWRYRSCASGAARIARRVSRKASSPWGCPTARKRPASSRDLEAPGPLALCQMAAACGQPCAAQWMVDMGRK
ncbi:hypothetical protein D9M68_737100 [compost metagenome]